MLQSVPMAEVSRRRCPKVPPSNETDNAASNSPTHGLAVCPLTRIGLAKPVVDRLQSAEELRIGDLTYPLTASVETEATREVYRKYIERYRAGYPEITATMPSVDEVSEMGVVFRLDR